MQPDPEMDKKIEALIDQWERGFRRMYGEQAELVFNIGKLLTLGTQTVVTDELDKEIDKLNKAHGRMQTSVDRLRGRVLKLGVDAKEASIQLRRVYVILYEAFGWVHGVLQLMGGWSDQTEFAARVQRMNRKLTKAAKREAHVEVEVEEGGVGPKPPPPPPGMYG